tara:strand:+ start:647 stop:838 length:192 start_codon:yes stop_codon:yes gene_type:complete
MKVGDCVRVDYDGEDGFADSYHWTGICTWTDGYKFEFFIDGKFDTWTNGDLGVVGAVVINELA